jgi:phosphohistidine phosphatase
VTSTTRRLILLRHARAEQHGPTDHERALALSGRRQAGEAGAALRDAGLVPDTVLVSSALRTRQTWDLVRSGLGPCDPSTEVLDALYGAGVDEALALLRGIRPGAGTVLLVGHEPTMSGLAVALAGPTSDPSVVERARHGVPTATWTLLDVEGEWETTERRSARLRQLRSPSR